MSLASVSFAQDWRTINPATGEIPAGALKSGSESNGSAVYIIRTIYEGGRCVGKYVPQYKTAYISYGGKEIAITSPVEIFCGFGLWSFASSNSQIPMDAVVGGTEADGSPLYIIRAVFKGGTQVGKYSVKYQTGYFPWGGKEYEVKGNFSILVMDRTPEVVVGGVETAAAVKTDYSLVIYYEGSGAIKNTGTNNNITIVARAEGNKFPFSQTFNTFKTPGKPFTVTFSSDTPVYAIEMSTDGDDAFRIAEMDLLKVERGVSKAVAKWGNRGPQGYCLSTDPADSGREWTGVIMPTGCSFCLTFEVVGNSVHACEGGM